eukprot:219185-Pelagomonas_calceolata.AAC.2
MSLPHQRLRGKLVWVWWVLQHAVPGQQNYNMSVLLKVWNSSLSAIVLLSFSLLDLSSFSACRTSLSLHFVVRWSYGLWATYVAPFPYLKWGVS